MAEEINQNQIPEMDENLTEASAPEKADKPEKKADKAKKAEKPKKVKAHRMTKEEKAAAREAAKNKSRAQKEWEDSLVAHKRVKREEMKRKMKRAMLILLVFSLILTSVVYIMLLFIEENNIRITASSKEEKSISLSFDKVTWTPYLDVDGPENMWNISYNPVYKLDDIPTLGEINAMLIDAESGQIGGNHSAENVIEFCFYLRNNSDVAVPYTFEMLLESNDKGLEDCMRVIWANHYIGTNPDREDRPETSINCYASLSKDPRMEYNTLGGNGIEYEGGGVEKIAYPQGSETFTQEQLIMYEQGKTLGYNGQYKDINLNGPTGEPMYPSIANYLEETGYVNTTPFFSDEYVFHEESYLDVGEMLCVYVCIWIEGSDFECVDSALGGYITLSITFTAN